jgi:hypothetical protein
MVEARIFCTASYTFQSIRTAFVDMSVTSSELIIGAVRLPYSQS